jgi:hypothetical protein
MTSQWSNSDVWVAGAIAWASARDEVDLSRVIGAVDGLNKVRITRAELEQAIRRLCGAGLLVVEGETFRLTVAGEALTAHVPGARWPFGIRARLDQVPLAEAEWNLDDQVYEAAVTAYRERFRHYRLGGPSPS